MQNKKHSRIKTVEYMQYNKYWIAAGYHAKLQYRGRMSYPLKTAKKLKTFLKIMKQLVLQFIGALGI